MINKEIKIPCPTCQSAIPFNLELLLQGVSFECPKCFSVIGITVENKVNDIEDIKILKKQKKV